MSTTAEICIVDRLSKNDMRDLFGGMNHGNFERWRKAYFKLPRDKGYVFQEDDAYGWRGVMQPILLTRPYFVSTPEELQRIQIWTMNEIDPEWSERPFNGMEEWAAQNPIYGKHLLELSQWLLENEDKWMYFTVR